MPSLKYLSDFNTVSTYARTKGAKDKSKRKSKVLRNIGLAAGATALIGGGLLLNKRGLKLPKKTNNVGAVVSPKKLANSDKVRRRKELLEQVDRENYMDGYSYRKKYIGEKLKAEGRNWFKGWEDRVSDRTKPYVNSPFYSIKNKPVYEVPKDEFYREYRDTRQQAGKAVKQIARNLRSENRYFKASLGTINL